MRHLSTSFVRLCAAASGFQDWALYLLLIVLAFPAIIHKRGDSVGSVASLCSTHCLTCLKYLNYRCLHISDTAVVLMVSTLEGFTVHALMLLSCLLCISMHQCFPSPYPQHIYQTPGQQSIATSGVSLLTTRRHSRS